ncbi:MAG TPA: hypothetical protein ENI23_12725, partial [bacterium]|nr:hypothetical protein [bacterium]
MSNQHLLAKSGESLDYEVIRKQLDFKIREESIFSKNGHNSHMKLIQRVDNGKILGFSKDKTNMIPYTEITDNVMTSFGFMGEHRVRACFLSQEGGKLRFLTEFPDYRLDIKDPLDDTNSGTFASLLVNTGYIGSGDTLFDAGALRMICVNGMVSLNSATHMISRNSEGVLVPSMVEKFKESVDSIYGGMVKQITRMQ